jgi:beta-galactosidase
MTDQTEEQARRGRLSRRQFLTASGAGVAGLAAWSVLGTGRAAADTAPAFGPASRLVPFDSGWLFGGEAAPGGTQPGFDDSNFVTVTLPHTVAPLSWRDWDASSWEKVWIYRKHFDPPWDVAGMRVFLDFAAAMTHATPTLNGHDLADHLGGYLPFSCEITDQLMARNNILAVTVDSTFNLDVPPDRPAPANSTSVDFWQPGGIYRDVQLRAVPQVFLSDVFAKPTNVLDASSRQVVVECTVDAAVVPQGTAQVVVDLRDGSRKVASASVPLTIARPGQTTVTAALTGLSDITLWDVDDPHLYTVVATLMVNDAALHDYQVRIGFREAKFELDGFYLNGRRRKLFGVNRHQFYPYAGGAMPDRVQRKDAEILRRDLNCNMVRCSHYPQSEAFYDACDELGLMAWEEAPGWGYLGDDTWKALAYRDVGDMVRRDRNHPSVIIWGARLNETVDDVPFYTSTRDLAHSLDDSRPTVGAMAGRHNTTGYVQDVFSQNDYSNSTGPDGKKQPELMAPRTDRPYMVSEAVGTLSGPAIYFRRIDTQAVQQGQATAHGRVHNIAASDDRYCGVLAWSGYDYDSGSGNNYQEVKYTGVIDLFRVPKPGAAIYQSQVDPHTRPVIQPAFYWDFGPTSPITTLSSAMICANLDRLEIYVAGTHFATATPDTTNYGHLPYPPSFVDFSNVDGSTRPELRIDGYLGSTKVTSRSFSSDPSGDILSLTTDDGQLVGDGVDATRVVFRAQDRYGAPRPYVGGQVLLSVDGPAILIGDNPFAFADAGGVGAAWVRTLPNSPGTIRVRAGHPVLGTGEIAIRAVQSSPGGPPAPYGSLEVQASPTVVAAGTDTQLTATFTNQGNPNLDRVTLTIEVPAGWSASAITPATFQGVKSGQSVEARWRITAPADTPPGQPTVMVQASFSAGTQRGVTKAGTTLLVPYASLPAAFNNAGISDDSDIYAANFDGAGNSYSEQALTAAGLAPGTTIAHDGISFTWPDIPAGQLDNVVAEGQPILVSGSGNTLGFLGSSSPNNEGGAGTIYYSDGTTSDFTVTLDNYFNAPGPGNDIIATLPYINDTNPATNGGVAGKRNRTVYVFYAGVPITPGKTVQAVSLPTGGSIPASGRITGMHIFATGVG